VPLRAIAEAVGRRVFYDNGLILINKYELVYEAERDRDLLDSLVRDNFSNKKIVELPGAMEPNEENVEPAKHFENVDYQAVYKTFYEKHLTPVVGKRSGMLPQIDQKNMNWQGYQAEPGFVCSLVCDMDEDGITELVTVQEYADEDISGAEGVENTSLQVKIYRVAENQIVCLDSVEIRQLLPLFSFVDVTFSNQKLFISGIGAWAGDPGYNSHHVISFAENKLTHETVSSLDVYTVGMYEQLEEEEKQAAEATLARLQELGFSYKEVDDLVGGCNLSAQRLALYSLFGKEGRFAEYFKGTFELQQGFFDYTVNVQP